MFAAETEALFIMGGDGEDLGQVPVFWAQKPEALNPFGLCSISSPFLMYCLMTPMAYGSHVPVEK